MSDDTDSHPVVQFMRDYTTDPNAHSLDALARDFAKPSDQQRVDTLQRAKAWMDDSSSWRKKADLMNLVRKMGGVHQKLRRVGR